MVHFVEHIINVNIIIRRRTVACNSWLGCGGDLNNFESKESCDNACVRAQQTTTTTKPGPTKPVTTTTTVASTYYLTIGRQFLQIVYMFVVSYLLQY